MPPEQLVQRWGSCFGGRMKLVGSKDVMPLLKGIEQGWGRFPPAPGGSLPFVPPDCRWEPDSTPAAEQTQEQPLAVIRLLL